MERNDLDHEAKKPTVNSGYASLQLAKALTTSREHLDSATRVRAQKKVDQWATVLQNILSGSAQYGSRTPIADTPSWATLEVVPGGFATGGLLASGPLQPHEIELLKPLQAGQTENKRRLLNGFFLTEEGLADLQQRLRTGCYEIQLPEEGALLVVAWLVEHGIADRVQKARDLLDQLSPWFDRLRFYPVPLEKPRSTTTKLHLQNVEQTMVSLSYVGSNHRVLAQKEAVEIWAPFYDRLVALFLETVSEDWPCAVYPEGWKDRAKALLTEYQEFRKAHTLCGKPERAKKYFTQLRQYLATLVEPPRRLTGRDVGRIRLILRRYVEKRGEPNSEACQEARRLQRVQVSAPLHRDIARVVVARLAKYPVKEGLDDVAPIQVPINEPEAEAYHLPLGTIIPRSMRHKVERCLNESAAELIARGLITSGETLARVVPQITASLRASGIADPSFRRLYARIYQAFRRRRSLLLLNLEKQVQLEELPWIAAIEEHRQDNLTSRQLAAQGLEELASLAITSFPAVILPNKLLQEMQALAKIAGIELPLVEEVATDIFMGRFSPKFLLAAQRAADLMEGTLYARYYTIDYREIRSLSYSREPSFWKLGRLSPTDPFADWCAARAGVPMGTYNPATNGMIVEQQQIVTTQNLAILLTSLNLTDTIRYQAKELAQSCFEWICHRQQMKIDRWHARMIMVKNTAYAWRQMIFFLSLLLEREVTDFLRWADEYLACQREDFAARFRPALGGLKYIAEGEQLIESEDRRRFLGWSNEPHWLLKEPQERQG
jgi:hypothetical protein